jgi:isoaspartyl peptidase/L-asparaginase-like protein (Ntn-hydrolase superfamily)
MGEAILRSAVSLRAADAVAAGARAGDAARRALAPVRALDACAGLIVVDAAGGIGAAVTGGGMPVARRSPRGGTRVALIGG